MLGDAMCCPNAGGATAPTLLWACLGNPASSGWFRPRSLCSHCHWLVTCIKPASLRHFICTARNDPLRAWGESWQLGHGANCCYGGSLGVCAPVCMCLCMFAATCGLYASHTCAHVYLSYVCMCVNVNLHVCPPLSLKHTHTCQENPRDPGGDRREDQVSGSGATGSSRVSGPESQPSS